MSPSEGLAHTCLGFVPAVEPGLLGSPRAGRSCHRAHQEGSLDSSCQWKDHKAGSPGRPEKRQVEVLEAPAQEWASAAPPVHCPAVGEAGRAGPSGSATPHMGSQQNWRCGRRVRTVAIAPLSSGARLAQPA